ncbi:MAG: hypothetical protein OJF51_001241 [Nitrospira sp.]|nr:MAG: hypothetical protein OJF51_001241 [Nitrospira sp.]
MTATIKLPYFVIGGFSCDERMLQVRKNLSQADTGDKFPPTIEVMDKAD